MSEQDKFPEAFGYVMEFAHHAAERAWTSLLNFVTAQSVLTLAWATILAAHEQLAARGPVMLAISFVGAATGLQWSLLGIRMWDYYLEYVDRLRVMVDGVSADAARSWAYVDAAIAKNWRTGMNFKGLRILSGNQWILFLTPLMVAGLHLVMWVVAVVAVVEWPTPAWWPEPLLLAGGLGPFFWGLWAVWQVAKPVLAKNFPAWRMV